MAGWAVAIIMMRTFVVAMMLASASSFAPSPKTQLATRRPAQAPPRVMPAMKLTPGNPLYYIGFPSQYEKDEKIRKVFPYHCVHAPWSPIASVKPHPLPGARPCHLRRHQHNHLPVTLSTTSAVCAGE